ncbi:MAG: DUF1330 domain-containing protein [Gemmataceae bacterium]
MIRTNFLLALVILVALAGFGNKTIGADSKAVSKTKSSTRKIEINAMKPTPEQMLQFLALPDGPIVLVNLLKFKPNGGREEYEKYGRKIQPLLKKIGARILFVGEGKMCFVGKGDWDQIALVEYPNKMALIQMALTPEYRAAHKHREAGLQGQINYAVVRNEKFEKFYRAKVKTEGVRRPIGRGARYGEVVLLRWKGLMLEGEVWATAGLNNCPLKSWKALDPKAIRSTTGAFSVVMNGPRYFLANSATGSVASAKRKKFGELETRHVATIAINPLVNAVPFNEHRVRRNSRFVYNKGEEIYELKSPKGEIYTMISMSQIVDPKLQLTQLPTLGSRLKLPKGWSYQVRTLDADLVLTAKGKAVVLQDDLRNTYQRR